MKGKVESRFFRGAHNTKLLRTCHLDKINADMHSLKKRRHLRQADTWKHVSKKNIRMQIRERRAALSVDKVEDLSRRVAANLLNQNCYQRADCIFAYLSCNQEVRTLGIIENAWKSGKRVAVPKVHGDEMRFYFIKNMSDVSPGFHGILEPSEMLEEAVPGRNIDGRLLMLVPGLAFDRSLRRVGYGGGYYDRFLSMDENWIITKVALAYDFQILDRVMVEKHDRPVDMIITPTVKIG